MPTKPHTRRRGGDQGFDLGLEGRKPCVGSGGTGPRTLTLKLFVSTGIESTGVAEAASQTYRKHFFAKIESPMGYKEERAPMEKNLLREENKKRWGGRRCLQLQTQDPSI